MAIAWHSKDPDETDTRAHDFSGLLDAGEGITSYTSSRIAGTVTGTPRAVAPTDTSATFDLSGGADGETSVFDITIVTNSSPPRTLNETILLPVASTVPTLVARTGYVEPTVANFLAEYPSFSAVSTGQIMSALTQASRQVGTNWTEGDFADGRMLYAAAVLTANGLGVVSQGDSAVIGGVKSVRSGALSVDFKDTGATGGGDLILMTSYGRRFASLQRQNVGGPLVTSTGTPPIYVGGFSFRSC